MMSKYILYAIGGTCFIYLFVCLGFIGCMGCFYCAASEIESPTTISNKDIVPTTNAAPPRNNNDTDLRISVEVLYDNDNSLSKIGYEDALRRIHGFFPRSSYFDITEQIVSASYVCENVYGLKTSYVRLLYFAELAGNNENFRNQANQEDNPIAHVFEIYVIGMCP